MMAGSSRLDLHAYVAALQSRPGGSARRTGAALRTAQGRLLVGCGIHVKGAPEGCAIHHAVAAAVAEEGSDLVIEAVVLVAVDAEGDGVAAVPCGNCIRWLIAFGPGAPVSYRHPREGWCERQACALEPGREAIA